MKFSSMNYACCLVVVAIILLASLCVCMIMEINQNSKICPPGGILALAGFSMILNILALYPLWVNRHPYPSSDNATAGVSVIPAHINPLPAAVNPNKVIAINTPPIQ